MLRDRATLQLPYRASYQRPLECKARRLQRRAPGFSTIKRKDLNQSGAGDLFV